MDTTLASEEENDVRMREMAEKFLPGINEFYRITEISVEEDGPNGIQRVTVTGLNRQTVKGLFGRVTSKRGHFRRARFRC